MTTASACIGARKSDEQAVLSRRSAVTALSALAALLTACAAPDPSPSASEPATDAPVSVTHIFGTTEIPARLTRVVAISSIDADTAAALGVAPVLVPKAFGVEDTSGLAPWFAEAVDGTEVEILDVAGGDQGGSDLPFEQIAAADPDVILGMNSGIDQQAYDTLAGIAPTVAPQVGEFLDPWQDITTTIGAVLGRADEATRLIADAEARIAASAQEHPEFAEASVVVASLFASDQFGLLVDTDESTVSLMRELGFTLSPAVDALEPTTGFARQVSREEASLLDADVTLVFAPEPVVLDEYLADPLVAQLGVVQRDRLVSVEPLLWGAFRNPSALTIPYALDEIVPRLAALELGGA